MADLRFDGRVAVVTGAGAGLGRAYALLLASRGAKVVVNDLGGGRHGDGKSSKAADDVVNEIRNAGGTAVADYNSVVEGEKIIKTALDNYGRVDILINNAGILRDKSFPRISNEDWDLIHNVHLKGSFKTTQAAFPIFKKQGYGRIIMTSSNAGLYGNFGQANYSAAKLGLVGLSNTIAIEGRKYNIHCNVITPTAASRLTEDIIPPDLFAELKPELIAPVVVYLCHESCEENGSVIESAMGWAGKVNFVRSNGTVLRSSISDPVTIENVRDNWSKITDMEGARHFDSIQEVTASFMEVLQPVNEVKGKSTEVVDTFAFTEKDLILYALGIGASVTRPSELRFIYENHEEFAAFPLFFVIPGLMSLMKNAVGINALPQNKPVEITNILHGEQYLEIVDTLPTEGTLQSKCTVEEILDKGSGAAIVVRADLYTESGKLVVTSQYVTFVVGAGEFGGPRNGTKQVPVGKKPSRNPDFTVTEKLSFDQAALYRLSGDRNPLHIDPNIAVLGGFEKPILHGLCSLGFSVRHVLGSYADSNPKAFKAVKARFAKPVIPGQSIKTDMWHENNRIYFESTVIETGKTVISGGYVDLKSVNMQPKFNNVAAQVLQSDAIFEFIQDRVKADPAKAKSVNAVFQYNITLDGKQVKVWTMDLKKAEVYEGQPKEGKPQTTLTVSDSDFVEIAQGKLNPQVAFMKGKLKVTGNIMLAQKLGPLLKAEAKL